MSGWLWTSALLMGLAGGPHCLAMCGAACSAVAMRCGGSRPRPALAAWQLGRLVSYAAAGALVASSVALLGDWGRELAWLRPWWVMLHLAALALGLWMLRQGRAPSWMAAPFLPATSPTAPAAGGLRSIPIVKAGAAGAGWVVMPCGLLQSALVVAALGNSALEGAGVMAAFAVGSGLSLWFGPGLWTWLASADPRGAVTPAGRWLGPVPAVRLAGAMLAVGSAWAVGHDLLAPWVLAFCR